MNRDEMKRLLHSHPDPYTAEYRPRSLPLSPQPAPGSRTRNALLMVGSALSGAAAAIAVMAIAGSGILGLFGEANAGLSPEAAERPCRSTDFTVRSEPWPEAPMAGGVLVIFQATEGAWCHISHGMYTAVDGADGTGLVAVATTVREPIVVAPGMTWQSGVYWSTYCGSAGGTVAAPEQPARPLRLSVAPAIPGEPDDGVPVINADTLISVATAAEIAPEPCTDEQPGTPFWLGSTGLDPYPGPAPIVES